MILCRKYHQILAGLFNEINNQIEQLCISLEKTDREKAYDDEEVVRRKKELIEVRI